MTVLDKRVFVAHGFAFVLNALAEEESERQHFKKCGWNDAELAKLKRQNNLFFCAAMQIYHDGKMLAQEFLGGCSYSSLDDFLKDDYATDMIHDLITIAKEKIPEPSCRFMYLTMSKTL